MIKDTITNAAEITVLKTDASATLKTGGGPVSVGATVTIATKGQPFKVYQLTDDKWLETTGKPLSKKVAGMEGLRHIAAAIKECNYINWIRVLADDAQFPSISLKTDATPPVSDVHDFGTSLSLGVGVFLQTWPIDGDPSVNRSFEIANVVNLLAVPWAIGTSYNVNDVLPVTGGRLICVADSTGGAAPTLAIPGTKWKLYKGQYDNRFTINFYDKDSDGDEYLLETYLVGLNPDDTDDMGRPAYIETVLEQQSNRFRCNFDEAQTFANVHAALVAAGKTIFTGGTNGGAPTLEDWKRAWDIFRNDTYLIHHMFAAGNYDADVLANCADIANKRRCSFDYDVSPLLPPALALAWANGLGIESSQVGRQYSPYSANDPFYGGKCVWGVSGDKVAAWARGEKNFTGGTPGVHYSPAGIYRGVLTRTGLVPLHDEQINRDDFYDARINPVVAGQTGLGVIDDALTTWFKQDYLRFAHVNNIDNYIAYRFIEAASYAKHEPDGITYRKLTRLVKEILDELVTSGALVTPRTAEGGTAPYILTVKQIEIDLWHVQWDYCPTGSARRIAGQPRLIK
jgi:hypothetical protein